MKCTIFYAWQSQLPNATNRSLIKSAIEQAAKAISMDASIEARPEVDHDTAGVPGSPSIADTIRAKIDAAEVVVCDVSIVQGLAARSERERPTPNPNVLVELGYALKSLGSLERVVLVMNTAYGGPEDLPFDLRGWRVASYVAREERDEERAETRRALAKKLEETFRAVLSQPVRLPATPVERLSRVAPGTKVTLVYTSPRSTQPHDSFRVETTAVDYSTNAWRCVLLSGGKPGTAEHIPLSDVEEVWTANETVFVRLAGYLEHASLEPYRYKSRSRSARNDLPVRAEGLSRPWMSDDAAEIMQWLAREYVKAGHPNWRVWNFSFPNDSRVAKELMALRFVTIFGSKGPKTTDWRLAEQGHAWIMAHREL